MRPIDVIHGMTDALIPVVAAIEAKPAVTQDRYDQYMVAIDHVIKAMPGQQPKTVALVAAVAMTYAGGNREGIKQAMIALGYMQ